MITMNDTTNSHQPSSVLGWESACFRNRFFRPSFLQQFHSCSAAGQREAIPKIEQRTRFVSGSPGPKDPKRLLFCLLETRRMGFRRILHPPAVTTMPTMTSERSSVYKCLKAGAPQVGLILCSELLEVNTHTILTNNMENDVASPNPLVFLVVVSIMIFVYDWEGNPILQIFCECPNCNVW